MRQGAFSGPPYGERVTQPPQSPQPPYPYAPHPSMPNPKPRRAFAIAGVVVAAAGMLVSPILGFVTVGLVSSGANPSALGLINGAGAVLVGLLSLVTLAFGIISLVRREQARVLAGAAIGIGVVGLVGLLSVAVQQLAYAAL